MSYFVFSRRLWLSLAAFVVAVGASADSGAITFRINTAKPQQTIEHFGASDAWTTEIVGQWPDSQVNRAADWLFSMRTDAQGKPEGIGLSLWRFNLGAGSMEQGDKSKIESQRRTECFLSADGTYDFSKQAPQRRMMRLAKDRGVRYFLAFMNSAPVFFTQNGLATNVGRGGTFNLKPDCYDDFARFMAESIEGLQKHDGIHFDYISPHNEADGSWNWTGTRQEGSAATNREIATTVRTLDKELSKRHLDTKIVICEASDYRNMLRAFQSGWQRGCEINAFFSKDSTDTYVGDCSHVLPDILGHGYWTNTPLDSMRNYRIAVRNAVKARGIGFWQSEQCIMQNDTEVGANRGFDFSMKTALYVARIIHHDLVFANAKSWSWWRAFGQDDAKSSLIRLYPDGGQKSGTVVDSKLLWTLGNFSRFVRPGAVRYDIDAFDASGAEVREGFNDIHGVMCSAYKNNDGKWVVVAINYAAVSKPFNFSVNGKSKARWRAYRTSDVSAESLAPVGRTDGHAVLAPRSVTTFVSE